jgi:hypothetical protein
MTKLLIAGALVCLLGGTAFAQSSGAFLSGKATASGGSSSFAAVSGSTFSSSSSSGGSSSVVTFKGVSSGPSGGVSYKASTPPYSGSCTGFCALFH